MKALRPLLKSTSGAAASEFVLAMPMMLILIFLAMEAGNFFWSQQKLVQAVREGARYAGRLNYGEVCPASGSFDATKVKNVVRTGNPSGSGWMRLPAWDDSKVVITPHCDSFVATGIYSTLSGTTKGAIVTVSAVGMPYRPILGRLGYIDSTFRLAAKENAPVIGI